MSAMFQPLTEEICSRCFSLSAKQILSRLYYIAQNWLQNFNCRITLGVFSFIAGLTIALGIALITIRYSIMKAATVNPAKSLKY
jgi:hypothetical protein